MGLVYGVSLNGLCFSASLGSLPWSLSDRECRLGFPLPLKLVHAPLTRARAAWTALSITGHRHTLFLTDPRKRHSTLKFLQWKDGAKRHRYFHNFNTTLASKWRLRYNEKTVKSFTKCTFFFFFITVIITSLASTKYLTRTWIFTFWLIYLNH